MKNIDGDEFSEDGLGVQDFREYQSSKKKRGAESSAKTKSDSHKNDRKSDREQWEKDPLFKALLDADQIIRAGIVARFLATQALHERARKEAEERIQENEDHTSEMKAAIAAGKAGQRIRRLPSAWEIRDLTERSLCAEVACALHEHENTARNLINQAEILTTQLAHTLEALSTGDVTVRQALDLVDQVNTLPDDVVPRFEQAALEKAVDQTSSRFHSAVRRLRERMHPESIQLRKRAAVKDRRVGLSVDIDGMSWLNLYITTESATGIRERLHAHAAELGLYEDESRTKAQLEADVAVDLLLHGTTANAATANTVTGSAAGIETTGVRATVYVTVPVLSLLGHSDEPAELEGIGPIDIDTARILCASATSFFRILTHPITGAYLSVGRESYRPPKDLKRFLEIRDKNCRFPGCGRAVKHCDTDHTVDWAKGGETSANNLSHLCRNHHRLKHEAGWNVTQITNGQLVWTSPAGTVHITRPEYLGAAFPPGNKSKTQKTPREYRDLWGTPAGNSDPNDPAPF